MNEISEARRCGKPKHSVENPAYRQDRAGRPGTAKRAQLDLADFQAIRRVTREARADVIVNAAAYTAVDRAEREPELAMAVNGGAPGVIAEEAKRLGALLVH